MHSTPSSGCQVSPRRRVAPRALGRKSLSFQAKIVLAHTDAEACRKAVQHFRRSGIELATAGSASEVHQLVQRLEPRVVFLDVNLADESGYLTCAKIKMQHPACKVVMLGKAASPDAQRLAAFAGADALVAWSPNCRDLIAQIPVPAAEARTD
jgi:DNA-binding response OmpR family regulator